MTTLQPTFSPARQVGRPAATPGRRAVMVALTLTGVSVALAHGATAHHSAIPDDLARLLRFMAALKLGFAVVVFGASLWRLARPSPGWRAAAYVVGPGLAGLGGVEMWFLHAAIGATLLHLGLLAWLAAALTDGDFLPDRTPARFRTKRDG